MLRVSQLRLVDSYSKRRGEVSEFLAQYRTAADLAAALRRVLTKEPARARTRRVMEGVAACRKDGLWRQGVVLVSAAAEAGVPLKEEWFHAVVGAAKATGERDAVKTARVKLGPLFGGGAGPSTARRASASADPAQQVDDAAHSMRSTDSYFGRAEALRDQLNDGLIGGERVPSIASSTHDGGDTPMDHSTAPAHGDDGSDAALVSAASSPAVAVATAGPDSGLVTRDGVPRLAAVQVSGDGAPVGVAANLLRVASDPRRRDAMARAMGRRGEAITGLDPRFDDVFLHQPFVGGDVGVLADLVHALAAPPPRMVRVDTRHSLWPAVMAEAAAQPGLAPVDWYPDGLAWRIAPSAATRDRAAANRWMASAAAAGHAVVQSPSSMLPVLALRPRPGDRVLDMCAAPGSKTRQLLDLTSTHPPTGNRGGGGAARAGFAGGFVIANERAGHRFRAMHANLEGGYLHAAATTGDARCLAGVFGRNSFDRVLLDAPCTGEGTFYKDRRAAAAWSPEAVVQMHVRQVDLLQHALSMVAAPSGGHESSAHSNPAAVVYSTCTLNPFENEAVVAEVLRRCDGAVRLVEPALPRALQPLMAEGISRWHVPAAIAAASGRVGGADLRALGGADAPAVLARCRRVLPHTTRRAEDRTLDAFFFARLERRDTTPMPMLPMPANTRGAANAAATTTAVAKAAAWGPRASDWCALAVSGRSADPMVVDMLTTFGIDAAAWPPTVSFVRRPPSRPDVSADIVAVSTSLLKLANTPVVQPPAAVAGMGFSSGASPDCLFGSGMTVAYVGAAKHSTGTDSGQWSLTHRGAHLLRPFARKRSLELPPRAFLRLLGNETLAATDTTDQLAVLRNDRDAASSGLPAPEHRAWVAATEAMRDGPVIVSMIGGQLAPRHVKAIEALRTNAAAANHASDRGSAAALGELAARRLSAHRATTTVAVHLVRDCGDEHAMLRGLPASSSSSSSAAFGGDAGSQVLDLVAVPVSEKSALTRTLASHVALVSGPARAVEHGGSRRGEARYADMLDATLTEGPNGVGLARRVSAAAALGSSPRGRPGVPGADGAVSL